jgi:uncharacterized membrane protein (DUF4010 family)
VMVATTAIALFAVTKSKKKEKESDDNKLRSPFSLQ